MVGQRNKSLVCQELSATEVADLYKERWQIELFFKRIKQNLVIKTFVGTTENAVMDSCHSDLVVRADAAAVKL